jgi:tetratricopeptide (TPR) repeat protein
MNAPPLSVLKNLAVSAAKQGEWQKAVEHNQAILEQTPRDTVALNRLGVAFLQLKDVGAAEQTFNHVLELDKTNTIAKRHLSRISDKDTEHAVAFCSETFIEEPGKTKVISLLRVASKPVLSKLSVGQACVLKPKKRFISIETLTGEYLGSLPEDISFRLSKLIDSGNQYECNIRSCSATHCCVYLKETLQSAVNANTHSFPPVKSMTATVADFDEHVLLNDTDAIAGSSETGDDEESSDLSDSDED